MDLWHSNKMKVLLKFSKDHYFWTLWTLNYVDCIPCSCIYFFHMTHNQAKLFKKIFFSNFWKNMIKPPQSSSSVHLSVCPSICDAFLSGSTQCIFLIFGWEYFTIYAKYWESQILENCFCCLHNWVNETSWDRK